MGEDEKERNFFVLNNDGSSREIPKEIPNIIIAVDESGGKDQTATTIAALNSLTASFAVLSVSIGKAARAIARFTKGITGLTGIAVMYLSPRVVHLAKFAKSNRVQKKNISRIRKDFIKYAKRRKAENENQT